MVFKAVNLQIIFYIDYMFKDCIYLYSMNISNINFYGYSGNVSIYNIFNVSFWDYEEEVLDTLLFVMPK